MLSVRDHEAFTATHLPDLGLDIKDFQVFRWDLKHWSTLSQKVMSPEFECGGYNWRLLLFPKGNSNYGPISDTLSLYLDYANPMNAPQGWHLCAQFAFAVSNPNDPTIFTVSHARHRFTAEDPDWGFAKFSVLEKLLNAQEGRSRPTIENGEIEITVYVRVMEDPSGVLWHTLKSERRELFVKVVTDQTFAIYEGFDLAALNESNGPLTDLPSFQILKQDNYAEFKGQMAQHFNCKENQMRVWLLGKRQNGTARPDTYLAESESDTTLSVGNVKSKVATVTEDLCLYLDVIAEGDALAPPNDQIMVFLKDFDPSGPSLLGAGKVFCKKSSNVGDLIPIINERQRWPTETPLKLYEEIKPGMIQLLEPKLTLQQSEIQNGDIICFQVELQEKDIAYLERQGLYSNPLTYYSFLRDRASAM